MTSLADKIKEFIIECFIKPSIQRGEKELHTKAGDVARAMNLAGRMLAICLALRSGKIHRLVREATSGIKGWGDSKFSS